MWMFENPEINYYLGSPNKRYEKNLPVLKKIWILLLSVFQLFPDQNFADGIRILEKFHSEKPMASDNGNIWHFF